MISVSGVSMRFGSKVLFEDVTTTFSTGRRYGLTGPNGAGKSTFMKLLTGEQPPQRGSVVRPPKFGVLRQDHYAFDQFRVVDTVIMGNARLWKALEERDVLYSRTDMSNEEGMRLAELEGIVGEEDGYTAESDAAILLQGLDIPDALHEKPMSELQGGQKVRVLLAQALFGHPAALLLDEPTNHLDLDSIHWLEEFLNNYDGTLIVISHDRHFLNNVCTHIADIDYQTIITYTGGYDDMVVAKTQARTTIEAQNEQREKKIAQLNDFIARFSAGTRSSQVQSRRKEVERLQTTELARSNIQRPYIKFETKRPSGKVPLEFEGLSKSFGAHKVFSKFSALVNRGDRIVLVGRNGVGKTTMLKTLLEEPPNLKWGHEASIGYFPQDATGAIEKGLTAVEWLHQFDPQASRQEIHGLLGQMLFSGEEGLKPTEALSGGETARLLLCRIMLEKPNVLLLDEPTNHLDLESINALNVALQKYAGTVLLVTHDQDLLEEVGTRVWHFDNGHIVDFKGSYEEFTSQVATA
ncbi:MAG TPA: ATP-binding cassette domain-containing protein [Vicinamibacterales bacterium]|nr:ATP-binding cassette domain-containing protein [Vicinamibacterales bacterium]